QSHRFAQNAVRGAGWYAGARISVRLVGLLNTFILARLLDPTDFGVLALAAIFLAFLQIFSESGVLLAINRLPAPSRKDYDSAWTLNIIICSTNAGIILLLAPSLGDIFGNHQVTSALYVLALSPFLQGFSNIGIVNLRRELQFRREFAYLALTRVAGFVFGIAAALYFRNFYGLAIAQVVNSAAALILSYIFSPYRPSITLSAARGILAFSFFALLSNLATFFNEKADRFVIGQFGDPEKTGVFVVGSEVGALPLSEIVGSWNRTAFLSFMKMLREGDSISAALREAMSVTCVLALGIAAGVMATAPEFVLILLGQKWVSAIPIVGLGALSGAFTIIAQIGSQALTAHRYYSQVAVRTTILASLAPFCAYAGYQIDDFQGVMVARVLQTFALASITIAMTCRYLEIRPIEWFAVLWRPSLALLAVLGANMVLEPQLLGLGTLPIFAIKGAILAPVYFATIFLMWLMARKPRGAESLVLAMVTSYFRKIDSIEHHKS
ncbi:MAG: oligosaccharide flippase family protein, partial [Rhodobacteraceae bacterium]|nr:oligosaccharide flippase family protein [Paracoccaceae bacterium]